MTQARLTTLQVNKSVTFKDATIADLGSVESATFTAPFSRSVTNGITAGATQTQAASTALIAEINRVTTAAATAGGVSLPEAVAGRKVLIINAAASNSLRVWPATGDRIDGGTVNGSAATLVATSTSREYIAVDATNWYTV